MRLIEVGLALVISFCLLFPFLARAESFIVENRANGEFVILHDRKCTDPEVIKHIPKDLVDKFYAGESFVQKKMWSTCWTLFPDGNVIVQYPDGEYGSIPLGAFRKMSNA